MTSNFCENNCCRSFFDSLRHFCLSYPIRSLVHPRPEILSDYVNPYIRRRSSNPRCWLCCYYTICCFVIATLLLVSLGFVIFFATYSPQRSPISVEVGGNVSVLLDPAGFDPFWYDQVLVTTASNITLFRGICDDLSIIRIPLPPKIISINSGKKSRLPFNYFGSDTPVYSADDTSGSFLRFNISAEAGNHNVSLSCGIQLFNFANFTSYNDFLNNELTNNTTQQDTQCIPVGPPGSPLTSSVTFYLNEPGFYWQAMIVNSSVSSVNSSVSGSLLHHNLSSLDSVHCSSDFQNIRNCTIRISALPSTPKPSICVLVLAKNYTTVCFRGLRSIWNVGTITIATIFTIMLLLCSLCCSIFFCGWTKVYIALASRPKVELLPSISIYKLASPHHDQCYIPISTSLQSEPEELHLVMEKGMYTDISSAPEHPTHRYRNPSSFRTLHDFKFDKTGLKCHLSDHGITVIIPENAINEDEAILRVGMYYVDSFQFPEGYRLVSEVFWIDSNIPLHKNVDFYMPHFVRIKNKNDTKKLKFFLASDESFRNYGVFKFTDAAPNHQYSFEPDGCYGKLVLNHFCSGCILEEIDSNDLLPLEYLVISVFPNNRSRPSWTADFVFSYAVPTCREVVISQYSQSQHDISCYKVTFLESSVKLVYIFEPALGWMIDQKVIDNQISEKDIDYRILLTQKCSGDSGEFWRDCAHKLLKRWENMRQYPPRLSLEILRAENAQEPLRTVVTVNGVKPKLRIRMIAPPYLGTSNCGSRQTNLTQVVTETTETHFNLSQHTSFEGERGFLENAVLVLQDHLVREWFTFGLHLGLEVEELNVLESNYLCHPDQRVCVRQMLMKWKNKLDRKATWGRIVYALKKIGNNSLAREVEERYMQSPRSTLEEEDIV